MSRGSPRRRRGASAGELERYPRARARSKNRLATVRPPNPWSRAGSRRGRARRNCARSSRSTARRGEAFEGEKVTQAACGGRAAVRCRYRWSRKAPRSVCGTARRVSGSGRPAWARMSSRRTRRLRAPERSRPRAGPPWRLREVRRSSTQSTAARIGAPAAGQRRDIVAVRTVSVPSRYRGLRPAPCGDHSRTQRFHGVPVGRAAHRDTPAGLAVPVVSARPRRHAPTPIEGRMTSAAAPCRAQAWPLRPASRWQQVDAEQAARRFQRSSSAVSNSTRSSAGTVSQAFCATRLELSASQPA